MGSTMQNAWPQLVYSLESDRERSADCVFASACSAGLLVVRKAFRGRLQPAGHGRLGCMLSTHQVRRSRTPDDIRPLARPNKTAKFLCTGFRGT